MKVQVKIAFKLFHQDQVAPAGTMAVTIASVIKGASISASTRHNCGFHVVTDGYTPISAIPVPDWVRPSDIRSTVRRHVEEFLKDTRFSILYDPETGIESTILP